MEKLTIAILACFVVGSCSLSAPMGVVSPIVRCGGVGTPIQLRVSECEGYCRFTAGRPYNCEYDFLPSSAAQSLSLRVDVCQVGFCYTILEAVLENSSIQPGFIYTAKYSIVPNDILSGQTITIQAYIYHTDNSLIQICLQMEADIL